MFREPPYTSQIINFPMPHSLHQGQPSNLRAQLHQGQPSNLRAQKQVSVQEDDDASTTVSCRLALTVLIGAAVVGSKVSPADAAYGESANVFGKPKTTKFMPYTGKDFTEFMPYSKWTIF